MVCKAQIISKGNKSSLTGLEVTCRGTHSQNHRHFFGCFNVLLLSWLEVPCCYDGSQDRINDAQDEAPVCKVDEEFANFIVLRNVIIETVNEGTNEKKGKDPSIRQKSVTSGALLPL